MIRLNLILSFFFPMALFQLFNPPLLISEALPRHNKPTYMLNYPYNPPELAPHGFFSAFRNVLGALYTYEDRADRSAGLQVDFGKEGLYYDEEHGTNSWEYYFEPIRLGYRNENNRQGWLDLFDFHCLTRFHPSRELNHAMISKYIRIKPQITKKIEEIKNNLFHGYTIGIHYRGTDKALEAPKVKYEAVYAAVMKVIENKKLTAYTLFVATDEGSFLEYMQSREPDHIVYYDEAYRSIDDQPVHFNTTLSPYKKGEDALIDCILLSECQYLIATKSHLSLCSSFFNLDLEYEVLNEVYSSQYQ